MIACFKFRIVSWLDSQAILWKKTEKGLAELDKLQQIHLMCRTFFSTLLASVNLYITAFSIALPTDNMKYKDSAIWSWCLIHVTSFRPDQAGQSIQVPGQQDLLVSTPTQGVISVVHDSCKEKSRGFCWTTNEVAKIHFLPRFFWHVIKWP